MCFSASASFIAGTTLCAVGVITLKKTKKSTERLFAVLPLLFGIQQLAEGTIWTTFNYDLPLVREITTYLYSVFSHVLWPIYVPFAIGIMEAIKWRRKTIFTFGALGIATGLYLLYFIVTSPVIAKVHGSHIAYISPHFYVIPTMVLYLAATCVSCFFSSHKFVKLFGILMLLGFTAAYFVHIMALVSIWCFFTAILSLLVYFHLGFSDRTTIRY